MDTHLKPIDWHSNRRIPKACAAVLDAFKFTTVSPERLLSLDENEWRQALRFCDQSQLTLLLGDKFREQLPPLVAQRIRGNYEANVARTEMLQREYFQIADSLAARSVEHLVLKGFSQQGLFVSDLGLRPQYDLDLWCPEAQLTPALAALAELGFESVTEQRRFPTDHLPPMVRKTGWEWREDYFDLEMPPVVELHFRLWDPETERFAAPGLEEFWTRRRRSALGEGPMPVMHPADQLAYAALHLVRHLLRGNLRALHVYELGWFLRERRADAQFWNVWRALHEPDLRRLQGVAFGLAQTWFGGGLSPAAAAEIGALPKEVLAWLDAYGASGMEAKFRACKDELWLHLALLSSFKDRAAVLQRRMIPLTLPGRVESAFVPESERTLKRRLRGVFQHGFAMGARGLYHLRSFGSVLGSAFRWWRVRRRIGAGARVAGL